MPEEAGLIAAQHPEFKTIVKCHYITMCDHAGFDVAKKCFAGFSGLQFLDVICTEVMQILRTIFAGDDHS